MGTYAISGTVSSGSGSQLSDYTVTLQSGTLTVNPYAFTYQIGSASQTYGTAASLAGTLGTTISTGVNSQTLAVSYSSTGDTGTADVGTYAISGTVSSGSGSKLSDYTVTLQSGTLTVNPYAFTYQIGSASQTYGTTANLAGTLGTTISTGVNSQTLAISYSSTGDTGTADVGTYAISGTVSSGSASQLSDYTVTLQSGTLTVNPYAFIYQIGTPARPMGRRPAWPGLWARRFPRGSTARRWRSATQALGTRPRRTWAPMLSAARRPTAAAAS